MRNHSAFRALAVGVLLCLGSIGVMHARQKAAAWPPAVRKTPEKAPVLSAEEEMKTLVLPPGYHAQLVAKEPLVMDPIAIDFDADGRMWVLEMPGFMSEPGAANSREPINDVVVLEDKNGDGVMDTRTVFADKLVLPRAIKVLDKGILVGEPPNLWFMKDTDGDLKADTKELVSDTYGRPAASIEHNANSVYWGLDNVIYTSEHDWHLRLKNGKFETIPTLSRGQWGATMDDAGRIYRNVNDAPLFVDFVAAKYYARNPNLVRTRGLYDPLISREDSIIWPVRATRGVNRGYRDQFFRPDDSSVTIQGVGTPVIYRGDRLPKELQGDAFITDSTTNLVHRYKIIDDGAGRLKAVDGYAKGEILASWDERFRPVNMLGGPDGTLYIVDMYRGVVQEAIYWTDFLRDYIKTRDLEQPVKLGRIWRIVHDTTKPEAKPALSKAAPADLVKALSHPNGWWRDTAQRLLVERRPASAVPALRALAESAADWRARLHALWTLDGLDAIEPAMVIRALDDGSRDVRAAAVRLAERWLARPSDPLRAAVLKRLDDSDWAVRRQLAATLGVLPARDRDAAVIALLTAHGDDPVTLDAALSGLRGGEAAALDRLMRGGGAQSPQRDASITMLAATIVRSAQETAIQNLLAWVGDGTRIDWQRSALLRGTEIALLGAAMPGTVAPRVSATDTAAPCPTCPGGRAGPGGVYAYTRPDAPPPDPSGSGGGRGGARLQLNREPVALTRLPASDQLTTRVSAVLARVSWPGKPGDTAPLPALTADEQRRFDAGRDIYRNICQGCHQPDGRGEDKRAPTLIGAAFTLAPAEIPARILLNGKEGAVGLMPPIGSKLNDEQIASVLTYVRREWGQTGTPVDADTVKAVRALSIGRTRPWTDDELLKLTGARQMQPRRHEDTKMPHERHETTKPRKQAAVGRFGGVGLRSRPTETVDSATDPNRGRR